MKYYSDLTKKIYEREEDLHAAEEFYNHQVAEQKAKDEERKADYQKIKDAYALADKQRKEADDLLKEFVKKYKGIHDTKDEKKVMIIEDYAKTQKDLINAVFANFPFIF